MEPILGSEVTVNPRFGRRTWVKLWVNEWLDGTTRYEMSDVQRAFWIDLLAMAGRSRYPGIICAGKSPENKYIGYPINKFQSLMSEPIDIEETLSMFVRTGKITVEVTSESPVKLLKLQLLNWNKFQSEYNRQKQYRGSAKLQQSDSHSYNQGNTIEVEGDTEVEVETEKKEKATTPHKERAALPDWLPKEEWKDFCEMRQRNRTAMTEAAKRRIISKLATLRGRGHDPAKVLGRSVENSWRGVFELPDTEKENLHERAKAIERKYGVS